MIRRSDDGNVEQTCRAGIYGLVPAPVATSACRVSKRSTDDTKPMSQDSISAGLDFEVNPRMVATLHFVHNT